MHDSHVLRIKQKYSLLKQNIFIFISGERANYVNTPHVIGILNKLFSKINFKISIYYYSYVRPSGSRENLHCEKVVTLFELDWNKY